MTSALVRHVPSANAPVNTFAIAYAVIPLSYPDYPIGADGHPLRLGRKSDLHIDRVYDQYGLPRCCMTHRTDPAKWKPEGEVIDLVSEEESEPGDTTEDDSSPDRKRISLEANPTTPVTDIARVVVRGRPHPASDGPEGSSFMLVPFGDWTEEDHEDTYQSLSTAVNAPPGATTATVPTAELQRLTTRAYEEMKTSVMAWFRRSSICFTVCNDDPKKSILVMSQRTGQPASKASLGSQGTQQHRQWGPGEMMLVICPGTTNEMVLADVTGISPCSNVNFDVLLSVDVLHAMSAGILPATPHRDAAMVFHPHNQQGDFDTKAYIPIRTLKTKDHNNGSHFVATPSSNEPVTPSAQHHQAPPKARWNALFRVAWSAIAIASLLQPAAGALIEVDDAHVSPMNALPVVALLWGQVAMLVNIDRIAFVRRRQAGQALPHTQAATSHSESPPPTPTSDTRNPMQEQNQPHLSADTVQNIFDALSRTHRGPANQENLRPVPALT
ncbi:hypothetical protein CYMTET_24584 [Cymbomonas tetramitiformis]|uniref:Uncharacterized protein n=1 Tax=Cymbomonas tetramitiformis TaxID=36881 RepID=A0AAE0KZX9_9CHLO|nr:hypothetical protein CYMTET_24584 [Cymbomonas tetramitiformis]